MPVYSYKGFDKAGAEEAGNLEASSKKLAFDVLLARGITIYELTAGPAPAGADQPWYRRDIHFGSGQLSHGEQAVIADLLATLFQSGLPITEVLRIAALSVENARIKRQFERVGQRLEDGQTIADAFEAENRFLSPIFVSFLKISDAANQMPELLRALARFFRGQNALRQKLISALIYPIILILAAIALLLLVVFYLAPNLMPIFASVGKDPPGTLAALMALNDMLRNYGVWIGIGFVVCILVSLATIQLPLSRVFWAQVKFRIPLIGKQLRMSELSRLTQATELLLASGQALPKSLRDARIMGSSGSGFATLFDEAAQAVETGGQASTVFDEHKTLPLIFKELFRVGETANTLPSSLHVISTALAEDVERQSQRLLGLLTPLLTLVLGLGIGFLIYTLMGAILEVNEIAF